MLRKCYVAWNEWHHDMCKRWQQAEMQVLSLLACNQRMTPNEKFIKTAEQPANTVEQVPQAVR